MCNYTYITFWLSRRHIQACCGSTRPLCHPLSKARFSSWILYQSLFSYRVLHVFLHNWGYPHSNPVSCCCPPQLFLDWISGKFLLVLPHHLRSINVCHRYGRIGGLCYWGPKDGTGILPYFVHPPDAFCGLLCGYFSAPELVAVGAFHLLSQLWNQIRYSCGIWRLCWISGARLHELSADIYQCRRGFWPKMVVLGCACCDLCCHPFVGIVRFEEKCLHLLLENGLSRRMSKLLAGNIKLLVITHDNKILISRIWWRYLDHMYGTPLHQSSCFLLSFV